MMPHLWPVLVPIETLILWTYLVLVSRHLNSNKRLSFGKILKIFFFINKNEDNSENVIYRTQIIGKTWKKKVKNNYEVFSRDSRIKSETSSNCIDIFYIKNIWWNSTDILSLKQVPNNICCYSIWCVWKSYLIISLTKHCQEIWC